MKRIFCLLAIIISLLLIPSQSAKAEVDIELSSFASQDINVMSKMDTIRQGSDKISLRFQKDFLLIRSDLLEMAVDFREEFIYWQEAGKTGRILEYKFKFQDLREQGASLSDRFVSAEQLFQKKIFKKKQPLVELKGEQFQRWKKKLGGRDFIEVWTSEDPSEFSEIKQAVSELAERTGVLISVGESAKWFRALIELESFPALIYRYEFKQADKATVTISSDQYHAVTKIGVRDFITPADIRQIASQRSFFEKMGIGFNKWSDEMVELRMLTPTIVIVILIFSPLWYPWLAGRLEHRKDNKRELKIEQEKELIRIYNSLQQTEKALAEIRPRKVLPKHIKKFKDFTKSEVYQKYFSPQEKKQYSKFIDRLSAKPDENQEELVRQADELLLSCDEAIKKIHK